MKNDDYTNKLEHVIKQMLQPVRGIPFNLVIEALSNYKVVPFDPDSKEDSLLLDILKAVATEAGQEVNRAGIRRTRPNEVGNDIEPFVKDALNRRGFQADIPRTSTGVRKATGYPDIEFRDESGRYHYLECKTYNIENVSTTQRSFYLSPSEDFKVTRDAHHFVISYEIYVDGRVGRNNVYKCRSWKILSLEDLSVDVKYEFNSDNLRLYSKDLVLAHGELN
jgi:hypothetical protein